MPHQAEPPIWRLRYLGRDTFRLLGLTDECFAYRALQSSFFVVCFIGFTGHLHPPSRQGACAGARAALVGPPRPAPRLSQEAARRAEVNMAAKASGEAVGERRGRARPCPAPACAGQRGLPRAALGSEAGRVGERGSRGAGVHRVSLTGTASAGSTVAGRVSSPALQ